MLLRYIALLDRFASNVDELDLSYEDRTLKIRKIPKKEMEDFLLSPKSSFSSINEGFESAIELGGDMYWMDYHYEVDDSREAMIQASNAVNEEMEKVILALRLFKEGYIRIIFNVKKGRHIATSFSLIKGLRSNERPYFLARSELDILKEFHEEFTDIAWKKKESKTPLGIALSRFTDGYERIKLEDRIIDYMIGLEALYLRGDGMGEFRYKMAHRASILLSSCKEKRKELFPKIKDSYKLRSHIVHGLEYTLSPEDVWFVEDLLRDSIRKLLQTPKPDWLNLIF